MVRRLRSVSSAQVLRVYLQAVVLTGAIVLLDAALDAARAPHPIGWSRWLRPPWWPGRSG